MNPVYEPPTLRILGRLVEEEKAHVERGSVLLNELLDSKEKHLRAANWQSHLEGLLGASGGVRASKRRPNSRARKSGVAERRTRMKKMDDITDLRDAIATHAAALAAAIARRRRNSLCRMRSRRIGRQRRRLRESRGRPKLKRSRSRSRLPVISKLRSPKATRCGACFIDGAKRPTANG